MSPLQELEILFYSFLFRRLCQFDFNEEQNQNGLIHAKVILEEKSVKNKVRGNRSCWDISGHDSGLAPRGDRREIIRKITELQNSFILDFQAALAKYRGFPCDSNGKESACSVEDLGQIPGSGGYPGEGNVYPVQYFCCENSMDRGAWQATVHVVAVSDMTNKVLEVDWIKYHNFFLHSSEGQKFKIKVSVGQLLLRPISLTCIWQSSSSIFT